MTGAAKNTVVKLLADLGEACAEYQDGMLQDLSCKVVEVDEIWSYCYAKQKNVPEQFKGTPGYGDVWTFTAICADTKLAPSWMVGERTKYDAAVFLEDLASRLAGRIQLSTDGHPMYESSVRRRSASTSTGRRSRRPMRPTPARAANTARRSARGPSGGR